MHSPAPWQVERNHNDVAFGVSASDARHDLDLVCQIPYTGEWATRRDVAGANAHLIAAAPDLLAALVALVDRCDNASTPTPTRASGARIDTTAAHAAIAKAKGE